MSSLAEKAAARRAKVLARASRGNSVTAALDGSEVAAAAALASADEEFSGTDSPAVIKSSVADSFGTPSALSISSIDEEPEKISDRTPQSTPATPATPMTTQDDADRILAEAEQEMFKDVMSPSTPTADDATKKSRPLAERRKTIAKARALAAAAEAAASAEAGAEADGKGNEYEGSEDKATPVHFISKSAREVEMEIASMTKRSDAAILGTEVEEDDSEIYKVSSAADESDSNAGDQSPVTIGSLREKLLAKKAARRESAAASGGKGGDVSGKGGAAKTTEELAERAQKLSELAAAKTMDPSAFPRIIRLVLLITLAAFSGYSAYAGNKTDALQCLQKQVVMRKEYKNSAQKSQVLKRRVGEDLNEVIDNNDSDLDQLFDENATVHVVVSPSWLSQLKDSTNDLLVNSAVGPYYTKASQYMYSPNEDFNVALLDSVYRPMFHRRSTDSLTQGELDMGVQYSVGDVTSSEGCTTGWSDTAVLAIFGAWILSTFTVNLLKKPVEVAKKDSSWFSTIWNFFTGDFDLVDYLYEIVYGICGELALFWLISFLVASALFSVEQAQITV